MQDFAKHSLAIEAEQSRWTRRKTQFQTSISADIEDFPEMIEEDLKIFFTGKYQLQHGISHLAKILGEKDVLQLYYHKDSHDIIKLDVRLRHIYEKTYNCYNQCRPNTIGYGGVSRYCCECTNGFRTIECCSHVVTAITVAYGLLYVCDCDEQKDERKMQKKRKEKAAANRAARADYT